ncbi:MAG: GNAT family N-acetyltransferase [Deltaproteobacteria bacterium]|nr:GNAT family N-acetyltransferase [Deltaproteobacteria bacterium]MBW2144325.1 GNAT family N-acetyltransferase [Deltaproteobacteria bacterium]
MADHPMKRLTGKAALKTGAASGISFEEATRNNFGPISRCLARAFYDDPTSLFLFPHDNTRMDDLENMYLFVLHEFSSHGVVYVEDSVHGAAVWQAPSPPKSGSDEELLSMLPETALPRLGLLGGVMAEAHIHEPHWYLAAIGTEPSHQGQGIGTAILGPILDQCDQSQLPAYLESSKESNIPFYERLGFRVTGELQVPDGPKLWPMLREPGK